MPTSSVTLRRIKQSTLTNDEVDANFNSLYEYKLEKDDAVSTNVALKVVKRDGSGNFGTNKITLNTGITLGVSDTPSNNFTLYNNYDGKVRLAVHGLNNALYDVVIFNGLCKLEFPITNGVNGNVLVTDGAGVLSWTSTADISITGNAGSVNNGLYSNNSYSNPAWLTSLAYTKVLPSLVNNAGKYLTTDGTTVSWLNVPSPIQLSNSTPVSSGAGHQGTSNDAARADHIHPIYTLTFSGGLTNTTYNGSGNITVSNTGVLSFSAGTTGFSPSSTTTGNVTLSGTLSMANGGTGSALATTAITPGSLLYINSSKVVAQTSVGTAGQVLISGGVGAPTWSNSAVSVLAESPSNDTQYLMFTNLTTGGLTTVKINNDVGTNNTHLSYTPSTGTLRSKVFSGAGTLLTGTATSLSIGGNAATATTATTAATATTAGTAGAWTTPRAVALTGAITGSSSGTTGSHSLSTSMNVNYVTDITAGSYLTKSSGSLGIGQTATLAVDATANNTASKIVVRDGSGNFSTNNITANQLNIGTAGIVFPNDAYGGGFDHASIKLLNTTGEATRLTFAVGNDADDVFNFVAPTNNGLLMNGNVVWHSGNDGSGSLLDADTVDGLHVGTTTNAQGNVLVRTDNNGYVQTSVLAVNGIVTINGSPSRVWGANGEGDNYLRPYWTSALSVGSAATCTGNAATSSSCTGNAATASNSTLWAGQTFSTYLNQAVLTTSQPTFGANGNGKNFSVNDASGCLQINSGISVDFPTAANITFHRPGAFACKFGLNTSNQFEWGGWSMHPGRMYLTADGDLYIARNFLASGNVTAYSDISLKTNIEIIPNALEKISQISGYTFDRTDIETSRQTGVIAQEVEKVLPEVISEDDKGIKSVAYGNMVGILIEAIKELNTKIENLEKQLALNS